MIYFVEQNIHGAWVVYGLAGVRQYYGYTKREAMARYREECKTQVIVNRCVGALIIRKFFQRMQVMEEIEREKLPKPPCPCDTCQHLLSKGKAFNSGYVFRCGSENVRKCFNVPPEICKYHLRKYEDFIITKQQIRKGEKS